MKFTLNGALTIGTLDGANIEIREEVGADNFFLFGLNVDEVYGLRSLGYEPRVYYETNLELRQAIDAIAAGRFSHGDRGLFRPLVDELLARDAFMVLADYQSYVEAQQRVDEAFADPQRWTRMSLLNVARMGKFSSDRAIREYCDEIWNVGPVPVDLHEDRTDPAPGAARDAAPAT
jgi:starch phosphorylase